MLRAVPLSDGDSSFHSLRFHFSRVGVTKCSRQLRGSPLVHLILDVIESALRGWRREQPDWVGDHAFPSDATGPENKMRMRGSFKLPDRPSIIDGSIARCEPRLDVIELRSRRPANGLERERCCAANCRLAQLRRTAQNAPGIGRSQPVLPYQSCAT